MKVILNDRVFDYKNNYGGAIADLVSFQSKHYQYQQVHTIKNNLMELISDFKETIECEKEIAENKKEAISILRKLNFFIESISSQNSKDELVKLIYNFILKLEGNGLLSGFGFFSKTFKNLTLGNAEKISLLSNKIL